MRYGAKILSLIAGLAGALALAGCNGLSASQNLVTGVSSTLPGTSGSIASGALKTTEKAVGATFPKMLSFNVATDVATGTPVTGLTVRVTVNKFSPPDGSPDVYYITAPTIMTTTQAIQVRSLKLSVNGVQDDLATTFTSLNTVVPTGTTISLSSSTMVHQLTGLASPTDTIGMNFDLLWPDGVALPVTGPTVPTLDGAALYNNACANCHGSLNASTKRNKSAASINAAIASQPNMTFLQSSLSTADVAAIAQALK